MEITDGCEMMLDDGRAQIDDECKLTVKWIQATWIRMSIRQVNRIYYLVGYTLGALNFQDPVTGGGKYDAKELQRQGNTPARQPYGQIHDLGPGSISSNIRLGYGTIHGRRVKIFHCCSTPFPRLAKTLKLHHLNSSEVTERARSRPTNGYTR
ncbi:hypothetical protein GN958_ATG15276 [Phytophthora infestans]|uniref:Uncharacterized protein n=1 Tax=Phytophthora infestans TaxID=4787 RepID=A0A8S9U5J6_PHYIN|nr:hypothetical protein GN958_ATG15276 [Phytophthora infestans]